MPKTPYKLISPQAGRHSEVCEFSGGHMLQVFKTRAAHKKCSLFLPSDGPPLISCFTNQLDYKI